MKNSTINAFFHCTNIVIKYSHEFSLMSGLVGDKICIFFTKLEKKLRELAKKSRVGPVSGKKYFQALYKHIEYVRIFLNCSYKQLQTHGQQSYHLCY